MLKVLILADMPGWIIDRIVDQRIRDIPAKFTKKYYTQISPSEFLQLSKQFDLVHYSNSDLSYHQNHLSIIDQIETPLILSVASHRYPEYIPEIAKRVDRVHVINQLLQQELPNSTYIPDGLFGNFKPDHEFVVGFAGKPDEYKGFPLITQACAELGVKFMPATGDIPPEDMPDYYRSIDLLVSASVAEGHCHPIVECMAMNIPVISTDVGVAHDLNIVKVERSVAGIKAGISKFYTAPQVLERFNWKNINKQMFDLYYDVVTKHLDKAGNNESRIKELTAQHDELVKRFDHKPNLLERIFN